MMIDQISKEMVEAAARRMAYDVWPLASDGERARWANDHWKDWIGRASNALVAALQARPAAPIPDRVYLPLPAADRIPEGEMLGALQKIANYSLGSTIQPVQIARDTLAGKAGQWLQSQARYTREDIGHAIIGAIEHERSTSGPAAENAALVAKLRESATDLCSPDGCCYGETMLRAADALERPAADRAEVVGALQPFAALACGYENRSDKINYAKDDWRLSNAGSLTVRDVRCAATVIRSLSPEAGKKEDRK